MSILSVKADQQTIRMALRARGADHACVTSPDVCHVLRDIALDWLSIVAAVFALYRFGWWLWPIVIFWVGNRQRALGNLLHDAGHRTLARSHRVNDVIGRLFLGPPLFASLAIYRDLHARHHAWLGDPLADPDYTPSVPGDRSWTEAYLEVLLSRRTLLGSLFGHLHISGISSLQRLGIVAWWISVMGAASIWISLHAVLAFIFVWLSARATTFHAITTFREMCDHVGLRPDGIFSFTREMTAPGIWQNIIHPHNNGYHLTHHLMPSIPYHRLPEAHHILKELPIFATRARVCNAYFRGQGAVVRAWARRASRGHHDASQA
ncbi:fatty acid desaturase [Paraburkholderia sp. USG1]|uniref:fatty acid desaturase family protein n=1 Tax=Paraburkholderia sp. USG1 TaxID=2952268 RepID=UPI0028660119|nr:fatty acid desaturase [Paraburkholderia sp. USG1]MDR8398418.1 fatty acid desaturase [Paraburkholderia sp. USG1]